MSSEQDRPPDPEWVTQQVGKFSPDDLRRAARVLASLTADAANAGAA